MGFRLLLSAARIPFFLALSFLPLFRIKGRCMVILTWVPQQGGEARIPNHANFSGCGFGPRTLPRFGG